MPKKKELIIKGKRYCNLLILKEIASDGYIRRVLCRCDCGKTKEMYLCNIKSGKSKSCGCIQKKIASLINKTHGMRLTRIYSIWININTRCNNTNISNYKDYGGRGIKCEWKTFEDFYEDMKKGYSNKLSIDRINNNGNYSKENCRWVGKYTQAQNKRNNIMYKGKCLKEWCRTLGLNYKKVHQRYNRSGWSIEKSLELIN